MRTYIFAILVALLTGCASTKSYFALNPPNDKEAIVLFIRPTLTPTAFALEIFVDGKKAATLRNGKYTSFSVPGGEHEIYLDWPPGSLGVGSIKATYTFLGGASRHFLVSDRSEIVAQTLIDKSRLYLRELSTEESLRYQRLLGQFKQPESAIVSDSVQDYRLAESQQVAIEIYSLKSQKKYIITNSKVVKVVCINQRGKLKFKNARLTGAYEDSLTFKPLNAKWAAIPCCLNCDINSTLPPLRLIAFFSPGSVTKGILVHALFIGGLGLILSSPEATIIFFAALIVSYPILLIAETATLASGKPTKTYPYPGSFRKHIDFFNFRSGVREWDIRIVDYPDKMGAQAGRLH